MGKVLLRELCAELGISRRVVQGMEVAGLVKPTSKNKYGYLEHDDEAQERIREVRAYQKMGFKTSEIGLLLTADKEIIAKSLQEQIQVLEQQKTEIEEAIAMAYSILRKQE